MDFIVQQSNNLCEAFWFIGSPFGDQIESIG